MAISYNLSELADQLGGTLKGDPKATVKGIATLKGAKKGQLSFLANPKYINDLKTTSATAVLVTSDALELCPVDAIVLKDPYFAFAKVAELFDKAPKLQKGVDSTAKVSQTASIDPSAAIGPNVLVGAPTTIGANVQIGGNTVISDHCAIDDDVIIHPNVTICHDVKIGRASIIHPGAVIGSDGFGNAKDESGDWVKVPQLGGVTIGAHVEIGANTTVDRGAIDDTVIENGVKIDNLVQIAHNVHIGKNTAMAAQAGIAGSTKVGSDCLIGGAAGITGHIEIGDHVMVAARAGVSKSLKEPGAYASGMPAKPYNQWRKNIARINRLENAYTKIKALEQKFDQLEQKD